MSRRLAALTLLIASAAAAKRVPLDDSPDSPPVEDPAPANPDAPPLSPPDPVLERLEKVEQRNAELTDRLERLEQVKVETDWAINRIKVGGYIDFGFFWVQGDGSGVRPDYGHMAHPEVTGVPDAWVLLGDPLSTAVNSRGEPADTGASRALQFNPIGNRGVASFLLNSVDLNLDVKLSGQLYAIVLVALVPRGRDPSDPHGIFLGDYFEMKLAYGQYLLIADRYKLEIDAGKVDSVLGIEYRTQESDQRIGVTPSLICRYTCGRPLGLRAKLGVQGDLFTIAIALSNGSSIASTFPLQDEIDSNFAKTVSGRIASRLPIPTGHIEIGASGAFGAEDNQPANDVYQYHYGFDLSISWRNFELRAEYVRGHAGAAVSTAIDATLLDKCQLAPCLDYQGAYGHLWWRAQRWLWPYARVDWRSATFVAGALPSGGGDFVYFSNVLRVTLGLQVNVAQALVWKVEYTFNRELGITDFPDDVLTSSLVMKL